jgi:hypothetical protein
MARGNGARQWREAMARGNGASRRREAMARRDGAGAVRCAAAPQRAMMPAFVGTNPHASK